MSMLSDWNLLEWGSVGLYVLFWVVFGTYVAYKIYKD